MSNNLLGTPTILEGVIQRNQANQQGESQATLKVRSSRPPSPFEQAMRQIGMPRTDTYYTKNNGDVVLAVKEHMTETLKWHKAFIQVFEFMEAQLNVDPFTNDPEAKAIYIGWISKGLMALRDEAGGGVMR